MRVVRTISLEARARAAAVVLRAARRDRSAEQNELINELEHLYRLSPSAVEPMLTPCPLLMTCVSATPSRTFGMPRQRC